MRKSSNTVAKYANLPLQIIYTICLYFSDQYCEWLVDSGVAGQRILLFADNISLNCANNDTVTIYDGESTRIVYVKIQITLYIVLMTL